MRSANWNELGELKVRMGLYTGEAELDPLGDEYAVSHTKNRASRIMSAAHGGQILLSQETANLVLRGLPEEITMKDLGEDGKLIRAMALWVLAINKKNLGQNVWAHKLGHECLDISVALGDRFMIAESYEALMDTESDPVRVRHFAEKHLALRRELGDLDGQMIAHFFIATNEFWSGNLTQARLMCEEGKKIASLIKNRWGLVEGNLILGYIFRADVEADQAINHFQQALAVVEDTGEQGRIVRQLNALGCAYATKGEWPQAERNLRQAIQMARSNHLAFWEVISHINLAEAACIFDQIEVALTAFKAAQEVDRIGEHTFLDGLITYGNGKAALLRGDLQAAETSFQKALNVTAEAGNRSVMKYSLQALAVCAIQAGQVEQAVRLRGLIESRDWLLWPMSMPWLIPFDLDTLLAPARSALGDEEYARLYTDGQAMTLENPDEFIQLI